MKQRKPLPRQRVPLKRTRLARGRKPIPQMSARRLAEQEERAQVCDEVWRRDLGRCQAVKHGLTGKCGGPIDFHEIIPRSAWAKGYLVVDNVICCCRKHHDWIGDHPTGAHALGLHGWSWERPA